MGNQRLERVSFTQCLVTFSQSLQTGRLFGNIIAMNLDRITLDPAVMSGKPCIRGLRVTATNILRQLANHRTPWPSPAVDVPSFSSYCIVTA